MRFLGNKTSIVPIIEQLLQKKGLIAEKLTFFDAFCGTGSVADYFKQYYDVDSINWLKEKED